MKNFLSKFYTITDKFYEINDKKNCHLFTYYYKIITLFNKYTFHIYQGEIVRHYWEAAFQDYLEKNKDTLPLLINKLKENLDEISCNYIDKYLELRQFWNKPIKNYNEKVWTNYDILTKNNIPENIIQPAPHLLYINPYTISNQYGLIDLPKDILAKINGKDIIDAGGLKGDTAYLFHQMFPDSTIHVYEPIGYHAQIINLLKIILQAQSKIIVHNKGLGAVKDKLFIEFEFSAICDIVPLDEDYTGTQVGLIKSDTESFETNIIRGASKIIQRDKPVLAIAIYHTPLDFFKLKEKLQKINPDYRFMIRRSEQIIPTADLVLIAY